jgi:thiamine-monophosphate kinase
MVAQKLGEFERIARFFAPLAAPGALKLLDDVAIIPGPPGEQYVLTTDAIVEGVHFLANDPADQVAQKLLRVNLSDLASKGATPVGYLLTTALPRERDEIWLERFAAGLARDQKEFRIGLLGGDSVATTGPVTLSVTAVGLVHAGEAMLRSAAKPGDIVFVSGTLGDGAIGLRVLRGELPKLGVRHRDFLEGRYRLPRPRLELGRRLVGVAHAMMDISDGLVADLRHICEASGVGAVVEEPRLPLSPAAQAAIAVDASLLAAPLVGGDDYELLFTAPADAFDAIANIARETSVPVGPIGHVEPGGSVRVIDERGAPIVMAEGGYRHF